MKKFRLFLVMALIVAVSLFVAYRLANNAPAEDMPQEARVLAVLEEGGCLSCHSANPVLPFYANLPVAGKVVMKDVEEGYRAYDIEPLMEALRNGETPRPVDVAKIEGCAGQAYAYGQVLSCALG